MIAFEFECNFPSRHLSSSAMKIYNIFELVIFSFSGICMWLRYGYLWLCVCMFVFDYANWRSFPFSVSNPNPVCTNWNSFSFANRRFVNIWWSFKLLCIISDIGCYEKRVVTHPFLLLSLLRSSREWEALNWGPFIWGNWCQLPAVRLWITHPHQEWNKYYVGWWCQWYNGYWNESQSIM